MIRLGLFALDRSISLSTDLLADFVRQIVNSPTDAARSIANRLNCHFNSVLNVTRWLRISILLQLNTHRNLSPTAVPWRSVTRQPAAGKGMDQRNCRGYVPYLRLTLRHCKALLGIVRQKIDASVVIRRNFDLDQLANA